MFGLLLTLVSGSAAWHVPKPGIHPEWGPEPPVAPYSTAHLPSGNVILPMIFPVLAKCHWKHGYDQMRSGYRHTGIDILGPKMSAIVAPFGGVIGIKEDSFWIYASNGWSMLGTHLNDDNLGKHDHRGGRDVMFAPDIYPGEVVHSGQLIGYLGESGNATGPHLHFEIYAPGHEPTMSRIRDPFLSLFYAKRISAPVVSPRPPSPPKGYVLYEGCVRKVEPEHHRLTLILTSKVLPSGEAISVSHVRYLRVGLSQTSVEDVHGWEAIERVPSTSNIGVMLAESEIPDDAVVAGIELRGFNQD